MKINKKIHILNEGYQNSKNYISKAKKDLVYIKKRPLIDLSFSAGSLLLGHNSKIFRASVKKLLNKNISNTASPNLYALEFSKTLKKILPNYTKFIFCSSGSESVMKCLRICKAITNKKIIINVLGSWHGSTDKTLFTANKKLKTIPISGGLSSTDRSNIKFIPYGNIKISKKILDKNKKKISCILIEPIQASLPNQNSVNYLKFLNHYCKKNKIILIFDEIITGLRTNCSSVQTKYNLSPDISTFGKSFGGGMPIGIIGVTKKIEEKIIKQKLKIFFGGTFSGNAISTFVGNETTKFIIKNKKDIFNNLKSKTSFFINNLNKFVLKKNLKISIYSFESMFRIIFTKKKIENRLQRDFFESKKMTNIYLFKKYLLSKNINYPSNGILFLSYQSSYKNIKKMLKEFKIGLYKYFK